MSAITTRSGTDTCNQRPALFAAILGALLLASAVASAQSPAPTGKLGGVEGRVTDEVTYDAIPEVRVSVIGGTQRASTDENGRYRLELPPGTYRLKFKEPVYQLLIKDGVLVTSGQMTTVDLQLGLDESQFQDEVVVLTRFDTRTAAAQLQARKESAVVQDTLSAEEMSRSPDSSAGDSARRVPGVTIVGDGYLVVRGLGGRYTNALLNGVRVPNADPDRPGVQLDLFPGSMLNSLSVAKTFSPNLPGNFAGGTALLETRDYPEEFTLSTSLTLGGNSQSFFRHVLDYDGGSLDGLGIDDGARAIPDAVPNRRLQISRNGLTPAELERASKSFPNRWDLHREYGLPDMGASVTMGDTLNVNGRKLGLLGNVSYGHKVRRVTGGVGKTRLGAGNEIELVESLDLEEGIRQANWGGLGTATYEVSSTDELTLVGLWNHQGTDTARLVDGRDENEGQDIFARRLKFVQRDLGFMQLLGDHRELFWDSTLNWQLNGSVVLRSEPDTRDLRYQELNDDLFWRDVPGSGERLYSDMFQLDGGGGFDLSIPVGAAKIKSGALAQFTDRTFEARRFGFDYIGNSTDDLFLSPEDLFAPENIGSLVRVEELTRGDDSYGAQQFQVSAYAMLDTPLFGNLRFAGGVRGESFTQSVRSQSPFPEEDQDPVETDRTDTDLLPAATLVYGFTDSIFLRAAYGGTVARPNLRELAPFLYQDFVRRRTIQGNPDLLRTYIHNFDLRWEWFPGETEVVAVSVFYKEFLNPIEQVVRDRQGNVTFDNVDGATNFGAEVEARVGLGHIAKALNPFSVGGNVSVLQSEVQLNDEQRGTATSSERPLAGQSSYVANMSLGLSLPDTNVDSYLYYYVYGRRIAEVGKLGLPDVYEENFHSLDLSVVWRFADHWRVTASGKNLLFQERRFTQGPFQVQRKNPGATFGLKLGWNI